MENEKIQKMKEYLKIKHIDDEDKNDELIEELYEKVMKKFSDE